MPDNTQSDFLLGRIDGKVDTILTVQSAQGSQIANIETRLNAVERLQAASDARGSSVKDSRSLLISIAAIAITTFNALKDFFK